MPTPLVDGPSEIVGGLLYKGEIFVIAGAPSAGKTRNQLHMLNGLALGQAGWWGQCEPLRVLYCSQRSWKVNSAQLRTVGIEEIPDNFQFFCVPDLTPLEHRKFSISPLGYIKANVIKPEALPDVICLDTFYNFLSFSANRNYNDYNTIANACTELYHWAQDLGAAVSVLHHASKQKSLDKYENPMDRILGSQALLAITISAGVLEQYVPGDPRFLTLHIMSHLEQLKSPRYLHGDRFIELTLPELLEAQSIEIEQVLTTKPLGPSEQKVLAEVPTEFTNYADISEICSAKFSMLKSQTYNILDKLVSKGYVTCANNTVTGVKQAKKSDSTPKTGRK
jgi:RecA-family ATPase